MQNLYVVSHTESSHHVEGLVGGWHDSELTTKGKRDAHLLAQALLREPEIEIVYSSDLKRARSTSEVIANTTGATLVSSAALREMKFGIAEGRPQAWLDQRIMPEDGMNRLDHRIIDGAETKREFAGRIFSFLDRLEFPETAVVSTHSFAATFVIAWWIRMPLEAAGYVNFGVKPRKISKLVEDDFFKNRAIEYLNR